MCSAANLVGAPQIIATARAWLGTPYHDQASLRGVGCDCLGLARGVWREVVGAEPFPIPPYSRDWGETGPREVLADGARRMMVEVAPAEAGPGALVLFRMAPRAIAKHVGIPLRKSPHIVVGNALEMDWSSVLPPAECTFLFGNPPFRGHQYRTTDQQADMAHIWGRQGQVNRLDYVTCWFKKAVEYSADNKAIEIALVSTNSITQGEQCGILWPHLFGLGVSIHFAHRTFQWNSEARGKAAVHCVIIGMTWGEPKDRTIFEYDHVRGDPHASKVSRINGYLIDGPQYSVPARSQPPNGRLRMHKGSQPTDGARLRRPEGGYITHSNLILDEANRAELLARDPNAAKWLRPYVGGDELISGQWRWCLWLKDADPAELRRSAAVQERLDRVRAGRLQSPTASVKEYAKYPTLFTQDRQPSEPYLAMPEVSSETREYIPMAVLQPDVIASNKLQIIVGAPVLYFGILTSAMHMGWMRTVAGRLESRYSYAPAVYNSFPWPELTPAKEAQICSSVSRAFFIVRPLHRPDSNRRWRKNPVAGQRRQAAAE